MKVLVTVKEVARVADDFEIEGTEVGEQHREYDLNEWDDYAIEAAVQLAEAGDVRESNDSRANQNSQSSDDDVEVVTATIGPERSEETIRMALAKGADRAVRVWDDALADAETLDVGAKAEILAGVVEAEEPDLVLSGVQAEDDAFGGTGVALAERVGYGWAAVVNGLDFDPGDDAASVRRELEGGVEELTDVELPAVLTIQTGINEPRYASLRGIRQAQSKELDVRTLADLGLDAAAADSSLAVTDMFVPETESEAELFGGDAGESAAKLATVLRDKGVGAE